MSEQSLNNPADVLEAIPAGLGFVPTDSIVAVLLSPAPQAGSTMNAAGIVNFPKHLNAMRALTVVTAHSLVASQIGAVILAAVWDGPVTDYDRSRLGALEAGFGRHGIPVMRTLHVTTLSEAALWADLDSGESGPTHRHQDSLPAARARAKGQTVADSKAEVADEYAQVDPPAPMLAMAEPMSMLLDASEELAQVISSHAAPSEHLVTALGVVISHSARAHQALLALGLDAPERAAAVWTVAATRLRNEARTWALVSAAIFHYLAGNGTRAAAALRLADQECAAAGLPTPRLVDALRFELHAPTDADAAREKILFLLDHLDQLDRT